MRINNTQDGVRLAALHEAYTDLPDDIQGDTTAITLPSSPTKAPGEEPHRSSPAKARMRLDKPTRALIEAQAFNPLLSNQAFYTSMMSFPTTGQLVMDTTLKDMLLSLQMSLMTHLSLLFTKIYTDIHNLDDRVSFIENSMEECSTTVNDIIDTYEEVKVEQDWI